MPIRRRLQSLWRTESSRSHFQVHSLLPQVTSCPYPAAARMAPTLIKRHHQAEVCIRMTTKQGAENRTQNSIFDQRNSPRASSRFGSSTAYQESITRPAASRSILLKNSKTWRPQLSAECQLLRKSNVVFAHGFRRSGIANFRLHLMPPHIKETKMRVRSQGFFIDLENRVFQQNKKYSCRSLLTVTFGGVRPKADIQCAAQH